MSGATLLFVGAYVSSAVTESATRNPMLRAGEVQGVLVERQYPRAAHAPPAGHLVAARARAQSSYAAAVDRRRWSRAGTSRFVRSTRRCVHGSPARRLLDRRVEDFAASALADADYRQHSRLHGRRQIFCMSRRRGLWLHAEVGDLVVITAQESLGIATTSRRWSAEALQRVHR